uniref:Uncharacterized protein n=1 Tax=Metapenaeus joyneri majanivirus TaxID=2984280 RepID=A0A9C7BIB8_9VIRU|nr:MAG: hypothetical protein [Metapenaeus joyneri majanivirus]
MTSSTITESDNIDSNINNKKLACRVPPRKLPAEFLNVLKHQNTFIKKIPPWEQNELRDVGRLYINSKTIKSVYYIHYNTSRCSCSCSCSCMDYQHYKFGGKLISNHNHRIYEKPLYVKIEVIVGEKKTKKKTRTTIITIGSIYFTMNPQTFFNLITCLGHNKNNHYYYDQYFYHYDDNLLLKWLIEDSNNCNIVMPLSVNTFKSLISSIRSVSDLTKSKFRYIFSIRNRYKKNVSPWEQVDLWDLQNINLQNVNCVYFIHSNNNNDNKTNTTNKHFEFLGRLGSSYHHKQGKPLYVKIVINRGTQGENEESIYITANPQNFLNLIAHSYNNPLDYNFEEIEKSIINKEHDHNYIKDNNLLLNFEKPIMEKELDHDYIIKDNNLLSNFKSLVPSITTANDIYNRNKKLEHILINYQDKLHKKFRHWKATNYNKDVPREMYKNTKINAQTLDRVYFIHFQKYNKNNDGDWHYYELQGRLKPSFYYYKKATPIYIKLVLKYGPSEFDTAEEIIKGTIDIFVDPQSFVDYVFYSYDYYYYYHHYYHHQYHNLTTLYCNINKICNLIREDDGISVTNPASIGTFQSLVPSIKNRDDIFHNNDLRYVLTHQKQLNVETSPWERTKNSLLQDMDIIHISPQTVEHVYFTYSKQDSITGYHYYEFLGRLIHIYQENKKPLYFKLYAQRKKGYANPNTLLYENFMLNGSIMHGIPNPQCFKQTIMDTNITIDDDDDDGLHGSIYVTTNPQIFLSLISHSYGRNRYNSDKIWEMIKDNIQFLKPLVSNTFKSFMNYIEKPDDNVGLFHILSSQVDFVKETSPWDKLNNKIQDLNNLIIHPQLIEYIYYYNFSFTCSFFQNVSYILLARLLPSYHYHEDGLPLYVSLIAAKTKCNDDDNNNNFRRNQNNIYTNKKKYNGIIYVTTNPQIFLNSIICQHTNSYDEIWKFIKQQQRDNTDVVVVNDLNETQKDISLKSLCFNSIYKIKLKEEILKEYLPINLLKKYNYIKAIRDTKMHYEQVVNECLNTGNK